MTIGRGLFVASVGFVGGLAGALAVRGDVGDVLLVLAGAVLLVLAGALASWAAGR